jgi:hypothetical protein
MMRMKKRSIACLISALLVLVSTSACDFERPTKVTLSGGSTPTFKFSGSGKLGTFLVYLVPPSAETMTHSIENETPVWSLVAEPDWLHGRHIEEIGKLTYGAIPKGYTQPNEPQPLIPGRIYFFECETTNAPTAQGFFQIDNGKTVPAHAKLNCMATRDGKAVWGPCPS